MPYSFVEHTALLIMQQAPGLVPGIGRIVVIYYDFSSREISARYLDQPRQGDVPELLTIDAGAVELIKKARTSTKSFNWLRINELPFETGKPGEVKLEVFSELEANVLLIPFENEYDGKRDLIYFYFTDNFSLFRLSDSIKALTTDHKSIIGNLLSNAINSIARLAHADREVLRDLNNSTISVIDRYKGIKEELKGFKLGSQSKIIELCRHLLAEIAAGSSFHYSLTPAAIEKLKNFQGDIPELRIVLEKAVVFATAIDFEGYKDEIRLDEFHIDLAAAKHSNAAAETVSIPSGRNTKTLALLDKLEEAAQSLAAKDQPLTGANVGKACSKSISAAAISDALKKYRVPVIALLNQYPEKWKLIRSEFKPVANLLMPKLPQDKKAVNGNQ